MGSIFNFTQETECNLDDEHPTSAADVPSYDSPASVTVAVSAVVTAMTKTEATDRTRISQFRRAHNSGCVISLPKQVLITSRRGWDAHSEHDAH